MSATTVDSCLSSLQHRTGFAAVVGCTFAINALSLALPIATLQIYDRLLPGRNAETLHMLVFGVLLALTLETCLRLCRAYIMGLRGAAFVHAASCSAMNAQLESRSSAALDQTIAAEITNMNSIKGLREFRSGSATVTMIELMFLPLFIAVMAYISQTLVLVPVTLLCGFAILTAVNGLDVRTKIETASQVDERRYSFLIDSLQSSGFMKSLALEKLLRRRFERLHEASCRASYHLSMALSQAFVHGAVLGNMITAATVTYGAYLVVAGQLSVGALIAVVLLASRLMQPVQKAVLMWLRFQDYQSASQRVQRLVQRSDAPVAAETKVTNGSGDIVLTRLSYRAAPEAPLLLDEISFTVKRGETLIIDGTLGSGRSALLKLIGGISQPTSGSIRISGADPLALRPEKLTREVGYLSGRSRLFRGTIRDNITRFGDVSTAQALEVAELLGVSNEFSRLSLGIDTPVGAEHNAALAPGLVQMLTILRVLVTKPKIILFDDANSGLDTHYNGKLVSLLRAIKPLTAMVVISSDDKIRQLADRRAFLAEGQLVEAGVQVLIPPAQIRVQP